MTIRPFVWAIWAVLGTICAALLIYRTTLLQNEDDQIFLDANAEHEQQEQDLILQRAKKLDPYVYVASAATLLMGLGILVYVIVQAVQNLS